MKLARMNTRDKILLFERLSLYLSAGMPILGAIASLRQSAKRASTRAVLVACEDSLQRGHPLSEGLAATPRTFDAFTIGLIAAGESSGNLASSLKRIAETLAQRSALSERIISICIYPAVVLLATAGLGGFLILYVFPKMLPVLEGFHISLPWPTRLLIGIEHILEHDWIGIALACGALVISSSVLIRREAVRRRIEAIMLRIPIVGNAYRTYAVARLFLVLSMTYESGISILPAFAITESTLTSSLYRESLRAISARVGHGERIADAFNATPLLYPDIAFQLIATGEATGTLRQSFTHIAEISANELGIITRTVSVLIEPALMACMGLVVGTIALAIVMPIYQITGSLSA